jgi:uroporphyrinogen decarboxylase
MRQAGRYMAEFREFSDKYPFRKRSETPDIAIELSLQPWRAFKTDGVIFFSDILTPLPALGIEFDVIKGKGPRIGGANLPCCPFRMSMMQFPTNSGKCSGPLGLS